MKLAATAICLTALMPAATATAQAESVAAPVTVVGSVQDPFKGVPVVGATITVLGTDWHATTDLDGRYRLELPPGRYEIAVRHPGYADTLAREIVVQPGDRQEVRIEMTAEGPAGEASDKNGTGPNVEAEAPPTEQIGHFEPEVVRRRHAEFNFGGRLQADYTMFGSSQPFDGSVGTVENGGEFRRARARIDGFVGQVMYKGEVDFAGGGINPKDVYLGVRGLPMSVRAGYQYEPWGLEQQTSSRYMTFMERSLAVAFSPDRNLGVRVQRSSNRTTWSAGVFREIDGWRTRPGEHYNVTARISHAPIWSADSRRVLHLGVSYIHKFVGGNLNMKLRPDAHSAPSVIRLSIPATRADYVQGELSANVGSLGLQTEFVHGWVRSAERGDPRMWAGYVQANFFLTGETRPYDNWRFTRLKPRRDLLAGGLGALELKVRYSRADLSQGTASGAGELATFTTGVNWYWSSHLRLMAEYSRADRGDLQLDSGSIWNFRFMTDF